MSALSRTALRSYARLQRRTEEVKGYLLDALRYKLAEHFSNPNLDRGTPFDLSGTPINVFCPPNREDHPAQVLRAKFVTKELHDSRFVLTLFASPINGPGDQGAPIFKAVPFEELSVHDLHALLLLFLLGGRR